MSWVRNKRESPLFRATTVFDHETGCPDKPGMVVAKINYNYHAKYIMISFAYSPLWFFLFEWNKVHPVLRWVGYIHVHNPSSIPRSGSYWFCWFRWFRYQARGKVSHARRPIITLFHPPSYIRQRSHLSRLTLTHAPQLKERMNEWMADSKSRLTTHDSRTRIIGHVRRTNK